MKLARRGDIPSPDAVIPCTYPDATGREIKVKVGSGATALRNPYTHLPHGTPRAVIEQTIKDLREALQRQYVETPKATKGTLAAKVAEMFDKVTGLSEAQRERLRHQLDFWCAQPAALAAPMLTPEAFFAARDAHRVSGVATLGDVVLVQFNMTAKGAPLIVHALPESAVDRILRVLDPVLGAWVPTDADEDPNEFSGTANHYRGALRSLFKWINRAVAGAPNPMMLVPTRPTDGPSLAGQDMRIVRNILRRLDTGKGRPSHIGERRLGVLAFVDITPAQLMKFDPRKHWFDVPDATDADILAGNGPTMLKVARKKGRQKQTPPPVLIPLNKWGVEKMRALVATPGAFAHLDRPKELKKKYGFSTSSLNKQWQRARDAEIAALVARDIAFPESLRTMTAYNVKHSLASALSIATANRFDRSGKLHEAEEAVAAWDHARETTTKIYTGAAVAPILLKANVALTLFLEDLFKTPLRPRTELKAVKRTKGRAS